MMRVAWLGAAAVMLLTGCGNATGERVKPPPPPAIEPGDYIAFRESDPASRATDQEYWSISLPQGGRSQQAVVMHCSVFCVGDRLPVRSGLNGLSIAFPAIKHMPSYDLAISVTPEGLQLSYDTPDGLWQASLEEAEPLPPPQSN